MREIILEILSSMILFGLSIFIIFIPPVNLFFTILGIIGMGFSLFYLIFLIIYECVPREEEDGQNN